MGDVLPDTLEPTFEYEGVLVWSKGLISHAGNTGVWLRWSSVHQKLAFLSFRHTDSLQHVPDACTSRSPLANAIFERDPAQAQIAPASVLEAC
eukprot:1144889-Pelagomonas_calceolata.AAC.1